MEAEIFILYLVRFPGYKSRQQFSFSTRVSFLYKKLFYPQNFDTEKLTKNIRRAYGSQNLHFIPCEVGRV